MITWGLSPGLVQGKGEFPQNSACRLLTAGARKRNNIAGSRFFQIAHHVLLQHKIWSTIKPVTRLWASKSPGNQDLAFPFHVDALSSYWKSFDPSQKAVYTSYGQIHYYTIQLPCAFMLFCILLAL